MDSLNEKNNGLLCPLCHQGELSLKYEAKYIYSYIIDSDCPGLKNHEEFYPFLYDNRKQTESNQYIECDYCGIRRPCIFSVDQNRIHTEDLQNVINSFSANYNDQ